MPAWMQLIYLILCLILVVGVWLGRRR